LGLGQLTE